MYLMRSVDCQLGALQGVRLSQAVRDAVGDLTGFPLDDATWEQASLPLSEGGLGIVDPAVDVWHARLAALCNFEVYAPTVVGLPSSSL